MIRIKSMSVLESLMERRYEPLLCQILRMIKEQHEICIIEAYRERMHCFDGHGILPVREIDLDPEAYTPSQMEQLIKNINNCWIYDAMNKIDKVASYTNDLLNGNRIHIKVCEHTRRR